ncbi:MAG: DUF3877 family protein [Lachnospiraceae bacterium]|nr:DUF3877 family protein [Lachnospiraceae bacterium]
MTGEELIENDMNTDRLIKNILDQVKEAQLKLGFARETVRLYYPLASLNRLLQTEVQTGKELAELLAGENLFRSLPGEAAFRSRGERIEISVPPETVCYVHEQVEEPAFLKAMIELFAQHHAATRENLKEVFGSFGKAYVLEEMPEGSDFDYVMYFPDKDPDEYYYCIKEEMGHTIYHRFMEEDYRQLL